MVTITLVHLREARRFESAASITDGKIIALGSAADPYNFERVVVEYEHPRRGTRRLDVAVYDNARYSEGERVRVLYDKDDAGRIRLENDLYDPYTPGGFAIALALLGAVWIARAPVWIRRVRRLAASPLPAFAMTGRVDVHPAGRREWLSLYALDATAGDLPVATVPLMGDVAEGLPTTFQVQVRGLAGDRSFVVARSEDRLLWPAGRARTRGRRYRRSGSGSPSAGSISAQQPSSGSLVIRDRRTRILSFMLVFPLWSSLIGLIATAPLIISSAPPWTALVASSAVGAGVGVWSFRRLWRCALIVDGSGLTIVNILRRQRISWDEVTRIEMSSTSWPFADWQLSGLLVRTRTEPSGVFAQGSASTRPWIVRAYAEQLGPWVQRRGIPVITTDEDDRVREDLEDPERW